MAAAETVASLATSFLTAELAAAAERVRRVTVQIRGARRGGGSGVIWHPNGLIVTNAHVARLPQPVVVLPDGNFFLARVVAQDPQRDLAALIIPAGNLLAATVRHSNSIRVGELVLAVGSPWGLAGALAVGIIHGGGFAEPGPGGLNWVRADVRLAPGNSGGPLADAQGRVLAINSMVAGGLALAIAADEVDRFLSETAGAGNVAGKRGARFPWARDSGQGEAA